MNTRRATIFLPVALSACGGSIPVPPEMPAPETTLRDDIVQGSSTLKLTTFTLPSVFLGECSDSEGGLLGSKCADGQQLDLSSKPLPGGAFRYYSQLVKVDASAAGDGVGASGKGAAVFSQHRFVM